MCLPFCLLLFYCVALQKGKDMTSRSSFSQEVFHAECLGGVFKDPVPNTSDT